MIKFGIKFRLWRDNEADISSQKFGFIKRVDKGWITTVKDLESWRFECYAFVRANGLTL